MATFTWAISVGSSYEVTPKVREARFGDGYSQTVGDGINNIPRVWNVSIALLDQTTAAAIDTFLRARGGAEAFDWTDPYGYAGRWLCKKWSRASGDGARDSINATFEQVYGV